MTQTLERKISFGSLLKFALPSIVMMVVMALYSIMDGMFVSRLINTDAFSAVNIVFPVLSIVIALGTMFGSGLTAVVSKKLGENKAREANENITFIVLVTLGIGLLLAVVFGSFLTPILYALGANEDIFDYCRSYAFPLVFFLPAGLLQLLFQSLFIADGKATLGLIVTIIGGVANIVLDYLFIGVCKMGIAGAAIATGIGYSIPTLFGIGYFLFKRISLLHFVWPRADFRVLLRTVTNGSSEMISNLSGSITTLLFNLIMMRLAGPNGVAAISTILYLDFILIAVSLGYAMGVAPLIGFNYGRQDKKKIRSLVRISLLVSFCCGILVCILGVTLSRPLTSIFSSKGTAVYEMAVTGLRIYACGYLFKSFNIFVSSMFTAFSNGRVSAFVSVMRSCVLLISALLGLSALLGITGVWLATPCSELLSGVICIVFFLRYGKRYGYRPLLPRKHTETAPLQDRDI